jgi:hypothetical protein
MTKEMKYDVNKHMWDLDIFSDEFVDRVSAVFLMKAFEFEEFKTIKPDTPTAPPLVVR